jgi:ubiquitin C-terminal hydrolase
MSGQTKGPGCGLHNVGNTCWLNATLQCLSHTPVLQQLLLSDSGGERMLGGIGSVLRDHVAGALSARGIAQEPRSVLDAMPAICKSLRIGRQEDAHEFLRALTEGLDRCEVSTGGKPREKLGPSEGSVAKAIFGGAVESEVTCPKCGHASVTLDPIHDLNLEINNSSSLEQALETFTAPEKLGKGNEYVCEKCKRKVQATKRMQVMMMMMMIMTVTIVMGHVADSIPTSPFPNSSTLPHSPRLLQQPPHLVPPPFPPLSTAMESRRLTRQRLTASNAGGDCSQRPGHATQEV